jgi:hypothetical protein
MEAHRQSYKEKMPHFRDKTKCLKKKFWEVNGHNLGKMPVSRMVEEIFAVSPLLI